MNAIYIIIAVVAVIAGFLLLAGRAFSLQERTPDFTDEDLN